MKDSLSKIFSKDGKKIKIIVAVGLIGILLIFTSEIFSKDNSQSGKSNEASFDYVQYTAELEHKLNETISSIDGVGECKVMITLENSSENVYATDNEIKNSENTINQKDEYVIYDSQNGETPVLIKEYFPRVQGVTVICTGGDNTAVKEKIIQSVTALFNISANRVSVSKIKT